MRMGLSTDLIARVLGGAPKWTIAELEEKFPPRNLPEGAMVTRIAPSPTGFMHIGTVMMAMINKKLAKDSGGVFIVRIEDTDTKREVERATELILNWLERFGLSDDEGAQRGGHYGPYIQSQRKDIYHSVAAELLATGRAYPCFLSPIEMEDIRAKQSAAGFPTGIYGEYARDRDLTEDEIIARLNAGETPSVRLYSTGDPSRRIFCKEGIRGSVAFPENNEDIVIVKSNDGLPTYHFAMLCDDHFMRVTHVVRANEWLASLPLHVQLYDMMGWAPPVFAHTFTIDKFDEETGNQRKLSKRKDPESAAGFYVENGWPTEAVLEYIFNLAASGYEEAKTKGQVKTIWEYPAFKIKKIPTSGALFDMKKLEWWAKEFIATLSVDELTRCVSDWADEYSPEWAARTRGQGDYLHAVLGIERDNPKRIRKDFITWKQTLEEVAYFFDDLFQIAAQDIDKKVLSEFLKAFDITDDKDAWWKKITEIAARLGISNGDAAMALRVALTGRTNTPDLYSIMQVMGASRVRERIEKCLK
ncbi:MAG: glutamate--tRNA ligase [Alphaproteobacteria bacterium]|nr:glutamate--tRNA ligase [Alphaproteobacteria bacterium]